MQTAAASRNVHKLGKNKINHEKSLQPKVYRLKSFFIDI